MTVGLVGTGPAVAAVEHALDDGVAEHEPIEVGDIDAGVRLVVAAGQAGEGVFDRVNDRALAAGVPWVAVELGEMGGYPIVDAAVAAFDPDGGCYTCLTDRIAANVDPDTESQSPPDNVTARFAGAIAGRLVARHVDPGEPDQLGQVIEVPYTQRRLLPIPGCRCGPSRDRTPDRSANSRDLDEALARAERGLDSRVGIISTVGEIESYPAPYYLAQGSDTSGFSDASAQQQAAGVDEDWDAAFMKALGEGLERYCAGVYRAAEFEQGTTAEMINPVSPSAFVGPDEWDSGADDPIDWVQGQHLASANPVQLPAELVHYPPPSRTIRPAITTGLGLGNSGVEALLSGLYEVIERDAATIAWYSTYDPLELAVDSDQWGRLKRRSGTEGLEVTALLLSQDIDVPVVGVAVSREEWPRFAMGTAADLDPAAAANDALAEAVQNWLELDRMGRERAAEANGSIGRYADRPDIVEPFIDPENAVPAASVGPDPTPSGHAELSAVLDRLADGDLDAYTTRVTTPDVERLGFEAVRVLVPEAQPLFFDDPYFGARAESVPPEMGFEPALDRDHHPYP